MGLETIKPGIQGIEAVLPEGMPKGASILLSGPCGAGKRILASEFLYRGRTPGVYYSFEPDKEDLLRMNSVFKFDLESRIQSGQFNIVKSELYRFEAFLSDLKENIEKIGAGRVVIDSLSVISEFFESKYKFRKGLAELRHMIRQTGTTALMITEIPEKSTHLSTSGVEEFVLDGIILLHFLQKDSALLRGISIRKMNGVQHDPSIHPFEITNKGIKVHRIKEIL